MKVPLEPVPASVRIAMVAGGLVVATSVVIWVGFKARWGLLEAAMGLGLLFALSRGSPHGQHWAGLLASLAFGSALIYFSVVVLQWAYLGVRWNAEMFALQSGRAAALLVGVLALATRSARTWFDLKCPRCQSFRVAVVFRRLLKCRGCGHRWLPHGRSTDLDAFD